MEGVWKREKTLVRGEEFKEVVILEQKRIIHEWVEKKVIVIPSKESTFIKDLDIALILVILRLHRNWGHDVKKISKESLCV